MSIENDYRYYYILLKGVDLSHDLEVCTGRKSELR